MKDNILKQLKTKFSNFGFGDNVFEGVASMLATYVTEETAIEPAVNGAEAMLKSFQSFADSRVNTFRTENEKNKSEAEKLRQRLAELEGNNGGNGNDLSKQLQEMLANQQKQIDMLTNQRTHESLSTKFKSLVKDVPESFYKIALGAKQFQDDEEVATFAETIKSGYEAHKQELINSGATFSPEVSRKQMNDGEAIANLIKKGGNNEQK